MAPISHPSRGAPARAADAGCTTAPPGLFRDIALGPGTTEVLAGDFRVLVTTLPPRHSIPRHGHSRHNVAYTVSGGVAERFGREVLQTRPGDVVLKPAGVLHEDAFDGQATTTLQVEWHPEAAGIPSARFERVLRFRGDPVALVASRLYTELGCHDAAMPLVVEGLAMQLLGQMMRCAAPSPEATVPRWLSRIRERLHDEPGAGFALRDLAAEAGVSADYLARRFRQAYGLSAGRYLRRVRLERAALELLRPGGRLADIAVQAGFSDQAHFTREFRRAFGIPPGAYRKRAAAAGGGSPGR